MLLLDCRKYLEKSLFLVGEIGGDDVNYGFKQGKPIDELRIMVPDVVDAIVHAVRVSGTVEVYVVMDRSISSILMILNHDYTFFFFRRLLILEVLEL